MSIKTKIPIAIAIFVIVVLPILFVVTVGCVSVQTPDVSASHIKVIWTETVKEGSFNMYVTKFTIPEDHVTCYADIHYTSISCMKDSGFY